MKVEILIYIYIAICVSLMVFNSVYMIVVRRIASKIESNTQDYGTKIRIELDGLSKGNGVSDEHKKLLYKELKHPAELTAFDKGLEELYNSDKAVVVEYICQIYPVFMYLTTEYHKKNEITAAYLPYIISKYGVLNYKELSFISDFMYELLRSKNVYCRENALRAIYSMGNVDNAVKALFILDKSGQFHHSKLVSEGLLSFKGEKSKLAERLWKEFDNFTIDMQTNILNFIRFAGIRNDDEMYQILIDEKRNCELRYSAIRYFDKFYCDKAKPILQKFARNDEGYPWEYQAIASTALKSYPCEETAEILKTNLSNSNWYVRYNSAESCEALGYSYTDLINVFDGNDRYAREMLRYRFDHKAAKEEAVTV